MECSIKHYKMNSIIALQGPLASKVLADLISFSPGSTNEKSPFLSTKPPVPFQLKLLSEPESPHPSSPQIKLSKIPFMSTFNLAFDFDDFAAQRFPLRRTAAITCLRIGSTGEDGFEFIVEQKAALPFAA